MDKITPVALLITGITVLAGCVTTLFLYIKSLHKKHDERLTDLYEKNLSMISKMIDAINRNSDTTERNNVTVNDLHKYILSQKEK